MPLRAWATGIDPKSGAGSWSCDIGGGMGAALNDAAAAMPANTLSDRGTWIGFKNNRSLRLLIEGDPAVLNRYDVIELDPKTHAAANLTLAHRLRVWPSTNPGQRAIGASRLGGEERFHASAANPK